MISIRDNNNKNFQKNEDAAFKQLADMDFQGYFEAVNLDKALDTGGKFISLLSTEYSATDKRSFEADILADFPKMILNIENQSTNLTKDDLRRMQLYSAMISYYRKKPVVTAIFCTANPPKKPVTLDYNPTLEFKPIIIYSKETCAQTVLNTIKYKFKTNNKILNRKERAQLAMLSVYRFENDEEFIKLISESIELAKKLNNTKEEITLIQTIQIKLIGKYGTEKQIEEILKMSELDDNKILQKYKKDGIKEGMDFGEIKNGLKNAITMFDKDFSISEVIEITEIPEENAEYVYSLSGNGYTKEEILKKALNRFYPYINY